MSETEILTEGRIYAKAECSEVPKCGLNTRHDNREVTFTHFYSFDTSANFAL